MKGSREAGAWEKIIRNSPHIIGTIDQKGIILHINEACRSVLGYEPREVQGYHFRDFIHPEDLDNTLEAIQKAVKGAAVKNFENRYIHRNGQEVPISWSAVWSEEEQAVLCVGDERTEQHLAKKKEALQEAMVEHGSDMLSLFDEELNCLYAGSTVLKALGYLPEQLIGTNVFNRIHPGDVPAVRAFLARVIASGGDSSLADFRYKNANGEWRWLETTLSNQLDNPAVKALVACSKDITERVTNKLKLKESEQRFKSLFVHHLDVVLFQNLEGVITDVNPATLSFFGVQKKDIINRPFTDFIPPELVPLCAQKLQQALKGEPVRYDAAIPFEGPGLIHFNIVKIPLIIDGETTGVCSILRDVTEATRSATLIRQQANKLHIILESITEAFFTVDRHWKITYANSAFERLFGLKHDHLVGNPLWELFPQMVHGEFYRQFHQALETAAAARFESYCESFNKWLQVKAYPSEEGLSIFLEDVTERVQSKQELEKLSLVASKTNNGVVITAADGLTEWVNEGFTRLTGYSLAEVKGKLLSHFLQGEETDKATAKRLAEKWKQKEPFKEEILNYTKSGEKVWFRLDVTPVLNDAGEVTKVISIQKDITFRKETEATQQQMTRDLFSQNKDLQQFTYIVSHNLRSPVANAMGLINLLTALDKESAEFDKSLNYLREGIDKMDTVLRDLNTILSVRGKKGTFEKEKVPLASVCRQALEELQPALAECGGQVCIELDNDLHVQGNKAYFYSIFYNLLSNAIKYRLPDRRLKVHIQCFGRTESGCIISISDNGSGFDLNLAGDKVFRLYKRFHTHPQGRGMGLFLVKTHVEAMDGHIEVTSQPLVGTRFLIYFR